MGIACQHLFGFRDAHLLEHPQRFGACRRRVLALVQSNRFADLIADGEHRIQRRHRLLENHRDLSAPDAAHHSRVGARKVEHSVFGTRELEASADDSAAAVLDESHDRQRTHRFAGSRFADDGDCFTPVDRERQVANGGDDAIRRREFDAQLFDAKNGRGSGQG